MRVRLLALAAVLLGTGFLIAPTGGAAKALTGQERAESVGQGLVGSPAPKLMLKTIDGQSIDLERLYGKKAVYLEFWATWCVPCRQQMPHLEHTYEAAGPDLAVIAVNAGFNDSLEDVQSFRRTVGLKMPIVIDDGKLGEAFHLRVTPQHIVIGRDGRIQYVGHLADERLDAALLTARTSASANSPAAVEAKDVPQYGVGDRLPDLSIKTINGHAFRAREAGANRPTVFVFISPWCESYLETSRPELSANCRKAREQVESLIKAVPARWLGIASGLWATKDDLISYRVQYKTKIPLALDESGDWFRSFRVMKVPTVLVADSGGNIAHRFEGFDAGLPSELSKLEGK